MLRKRQPVPDRVVTRVGPLLRVLDEVAQQMVFKAGGVVTNAGETGTQSMFGARDTSICTRGPEAIQIRLPAPGVKLFERIPPARRDNFHGSVMRTGYRVGGGRTRHPAIGEPAG